MLPPLTAQWPLAGDARDAAGTHHGEAHGVQFRDGAAWFNGRDSEVRVAHAADLPFGSGDFSLALRLRAPGPMAGVYGDVIGKYDPEFRCGFLLHLAGSASGYCGMGDARHVHFGIDDGYLGPVVDHGQPFPGNSLITNLVAYEGELYAAIADAPNPADAAHVFRWAGGDRWVDCGRLGTDPAILSVQSLGVHGGRLYAGTGVWDWERAGRGVAGFDPSPTRVFVYEGGTTWRDLGQVGTTSARVLTMVSFNGDLYVGLDRGGGGHVFRYHAETWEDCGALTGDNVETLVAFEGQLHASTHKVFFRYHGGHEWETLATQPFEITQIHSSQVYQSRLWYGTWPQGYVLRRESDGEWVNTGRLGLPPEQAEHDCNEINSLIVYNGKLYAGVIPKSQVYRYDGDGRWTLIGRFGSRPDWRTANYAMWSRVTCLTSFQGRLFVGSGSCISRATDCDRDGTLGRVYSFTAGTVVSHDRDLGEDWAHLAAVRCGRQLRLYVNGQLAATAAAPRLQTFDLTTLQPLLLGNGPQNHFRGALADVRLYAGALTPPQIRRLAVTSG